MRASIRVKSIVFAQSYFPLITEKLKKRKPTTTTLSQKMTDAEIVAAYSPAIKTKRQVLVELNDMVTTGSSTEPIIWYTKKEIISARYNEQTEKWHVESFVKSKMPWAKGTRIAL